MNFITGIRSYNSQCNRYHSENCKITQLLRNVEHITVYSYAIQATIHYTRHSTTAPLHLHPSENQAALCTPVGISIEMRAIGTNY